METTILVIDPNSAVRAITAAALGKFNVEVVALEEATDALDVIMKYQPRLVLCAEEAPGMEAFELCRRIKTDASLKHIGFILLAPASHEAKVGPRAERAGVDKTLFKPFKAALLRSSVEPFLQPRSAVTNKELEIALAVDDPLLANALERLLKKCGAAIHHLQESQLSGGERFEAVIVGREAYSDFIWYRPQEMGKLLVIAPPEPRSDLRILPEDAELLTRPLATDAILSALQLRTPQESSQESGPLETQEQALLAARISARVYEKLLTQESLRYRKWEEACSSIAAEALRICRELG